MQVKTKDQNRKTVLGQKQDSMKQKLNLKDKIVPSEKITFKILHINCLQIHFFFFFYLLSNQLTDLWVTYEFIV